MIKKNNKTIEAVYHGSTPIEKIYKGTKLVYEAWKNLTSTGVPPLTLANCKNTNLLDYRIYGNSVQVKNLYTNKFTTLNSQITVGENGWLNLNITTSGFKNFNSNPSIEILPNTIYTVILETSADYSDSGNTYLSVNSSPVGSSDIPQFTTTWTNTLRANQKYKILLTSSENPQETGKILLRSYFGNTAGNTVTGAIRISLIKGNIDVNNFVYEDYILSPDNPIEIQSVGDKSKNLIDISNFTTQTVTGVTYTNNGDGTITINGTATGWGQTSLTSIGYTISGINGVASFVALSGSYTTTSSSYPRAGLIAPSNSSVNYPVLNSSNSYTFTSDKSINRFVFQHTIGNVFNNLVVGLQVEEGSAATKFIPYNKYKIPIIVTQNQTKFDKVYNQAKNGTAVYDDKGNRIEENDMIGIPRAYSTVFCSQYLAAPDNAAIQNYMMFYDENKNAISNANVTIEYINCPTFRYLGGYPTIMVVEGYKNETNSWKVKINDPDIKYMRMGNRNTSDTVTSYASNRYIAVESQNNIYLNEPLRKIGDFADYLDFKNGKVVRNINRKTMTSNEYTETYASTLYAWQTQQAVPYGHTLSTLPNANNTILTMSNMFKGDTWDNMYLDRNKGTKILVANNGVNLNYIYLQNFTSTTDLKTFLQNNAGILYVDYVIATPIEESITLPNILLNKGTNVIDVNTTIKPSNMYVEYKGK